MAQPFDVVVVGARCAGAPLATMLAKRGLHICLLDRATFPSDTPSTHGIQPTGVQVLDRLGVLDEVLSVGAAVDRGHVAFDEVRLTVESIVEVVGAPMVNIRRSTLDVLLVNAAGRAGVDVRTGTAVTELLSERGRVCGVRTDSGEALPAHLVVGADGVRSTVSKLTGALEYANTECGRIFLWTYLADAPADPRTAWIGRVGENAYLASATDGGLFMAAVAPPSARRAAALADRPGFFASALSGWPELAARLEGGERVGPVRVMSNMRGYFRQSAGRGWALLGDAGHFKDPTPGQGIADALRQGEKLAEAISRGLGDPAGPDAALRDWWTWRDRDAWQMYWLAYDLGRARPTPRLVHEVERRMGADPQLASRLIRVLNHELEPSLLFEPRLLVSALASALRTGRGHRGQLLGEVAQLAADEVRRARARRRAPSAAVG